MSLSNKIQDEYGDRCCKVEDVREAVKELKERFEKWECFEDWEPYSRDEKEKIIAIIDEIFGEKLC